MDKMLIHNRFQSAVSGRARGFPNARWFTTIAAAIVALAFARPALAQEEPSTTDRPHIRFGLSGTHGVSVVGQGSWYPTYPAFVGVHARLGVQWNDRFATYFTAGVSPIPFLFSYRLGVLAEWTVRPYFAVATGAVLDAFAITDASAHAIAAPIAISLLPGRRSFDNRHPAFTITLSLAPGVTVYLPGDGCYCAAGTVRQNGFTFTGQLEFGFDLR